MNLKKKKGNFSYESSLEGIRLMTSPCTRSRHAPSRRVLDRLGKKYIHSASIISLDLNVRKLLILFGKNKVDFDFFLFLLNKFDAFFNRKVKPISANLKIPSP